MLVRIRIRRAFGSLQLLGILYCILPSSKKGYAYGSMPKTAAQFVWVCSSKESSIDATLTTIPTHNACAWGSAGTVRRPPHTHNSRFNFLMVILSFLVVATCSRDN